MSFRLEVRPRTRSKIRSWLRLETKLRSRIRCIRCLQPLCWEGTQVAISVALVAGQSTAFGSFQGSSNPIQTQINATEMIFHPVALVCPQCNYAVRTSVDRDFQGWGWAVALCCFAGCICALVPCCMDDLHEYKHRCPKCRQVTQ